MQKTKRIGDSRALGRSFHADVFICGDPRARLVLFGGSGVTREKYESRASTITAQFDRALEEIASHGLAFELWYLTSPYDVELRRIPEDDELAEKWTNHVHTDVMGDERVAYLWGYSGSAPLALTVANRLGDKCLGGGALGGDALSDELYRPEHWGEPIALYYNAGDRVYGANQRVITSLVRDRQAAVYRARPGGHSLEDYVARTARSRR
ncbi:MAG: hypothetical protein HYV07_14065 [Deltaproteobacteria bacterium]|nr:hypothetical protein [Deltaproteobacteria bacterium]